MPIDPKALERAKARCTCPAGEHYQTGRHLTESEIDSVCLSLLFANTESEKLRVAREAIAKSDWIDSCVCDVAELPDRDSPEDWPEAMLVTGRELKTIIRERIDDALAALAALDATQPEAPVTTETMLAGAAELEAIASGLRDAAAGRVTPMEEIDPE